MKIHELILLLNNAEIPLLKDFIASPIYNKKSELSLFILEVIRIVKKNPDLIDIDNEKLYKKIYPKDLYKDYKMRRLKADAIKLIEDFFVFLMKQREETAIDLIQFYKERNAFTLAEKKIQKQEAIFENIEYKSPDVYNNMYHLYVLQETLLKGESNNDLVFKTLDSQVKSFAIAHSKILLNLFTFDSKFVNKINHIKLTISFLDWIQNINYTESLLLTLYINLLLLKTQGEKQDKLTYYSKIKNILLTIKGQIDTSENLFLALSIRNKCAEDINNGDLSQVEEVYFWDQYVLLDKKLSAELEKKMDINVYMSFSNTSITFKKFEFAQNFIDKYDAYLPIDYRNQYRLFLTALLLFVQKKYADARSILLEFDNLPKTHDNLKIKSYILWIKIYYEIENYNLLESYINRLRVFCSRNNMVAQSRLKADTNFLIIINKLLKISYSKDALGINTKLLEEISNLIVNSYPVSSYTWLLEKVQELYDLKKQKQFS